MVLCTHTLVDLTDLHAAERKQALEDMDLATVDVARAELRQLARRGGLPWCDQGYQVSLKYIAAGDIITVPIVHCLLRGVVRSLFVYSLDTKVKSVPDKHPVVFNQAARAAVKVCIQVANT